MKTERDILRRDGGNLGSNILMFCCQCAGGGSALDYVEPDDVNFELVPCAGKIDAQRLMKAFEGGADGVVIVGCPPGECGMAEGNHRAHRRTGYVRGLLDEIGIGGDRIEIVMPQADMRAMVDSIDLAVSKIRNLGSTMLKAA